MTDPFEHFGEQQDSWEAIQRFGEELARQAHTVLEQQPDADPVGMILSADCSEAAEMLKLPEVQAAAGSGPAGSPAGTIVTLAPRALALEIIRNNHPALLEWLMSSEETTDGGKLPVLVITRHGARVAQISHRTGDERD